MLRNLHLRTVLFSLLGLGIAGFLLLFSWAWHTRSVADECIRDLKGLRVGKASFQEVESFRRRYLSHVFLNNSGSCTSDACSFSIGFANRISFLTLRQSGMAASIGFTKGSLQEVKLGASCAGADRKIPYIPTFVVMVNQAVYNPKFRGGAVGSGNGFVFDIGQDATEEQIAKLYGLNLDFLDHLGGCHDATEMFAENPAQWPRSIWGNRPGSEALPEPTTSP